MGWLFSAFAVVWVVFFLYLFNLNRRQRDISRQIRTLRDSLDRGAAS